MVAQMPPELAQVASKLLGFCGARKTAVREKKEKVRLTPPFISRIISTQTPAMRPSRTTQEREKTERQLCNICCVCRRVVC